MFSYVAVQETTQWEASEDALGTQSGHEPIDKRRQNQENEMEEWLECQHGVLINDGDKNGLQWLILNERV